MWGIYNVHINGGGKGQIVFDGNKIFDVYQTGRPTPREITEWVDGKGAFAEPAMVSMHEHDRWGESHKEDPEHLERAAIAGGMGTIAPMPNTNPAFIYFRQFEERLAGFKNSPLTVKAFGGVTRDNFSERREMWKYHRNSLAGFKLAMASTTNPATLVDDRPSQRKILEENAEIGALTAIHAEAEDYINRSRQQILREQGSLLVRHHCLVRNSEVEVEGVRRILEDHYAIGSKSPIHICHLSTLGGLYLVKRARERGQNVTCETCPHYWVFNQTMIERVSAGKYKMNPALRPPWEQQGIMEALCRGEIDVVTTDHAPHEPEAKLHEELDKCPSGVPGVQTALLLTFDLRARGLMTKETFTKVTSENAARLLVLNKGVLKKGADADVVLIAPDETTTFTDESMKYKWATTPFHGMTVAGRITTVVLGGKIVKS